MRMRKLQLKMYSRCRLNGGSDTGRAFWTGQQEPGRVRHRSVQMVKIVTRSRSEMLEPLSNRIPGKKERDRIISGERKSQNILHCQLKNTNKSKEIEKSA